MCYANLVYARGVERFVAELAPRGVAGLIVPDLPLEEGDEFLAACGARRRRARAAGRADHARTTACRRSAPAPAASSTRSRSPARPASALRRAQARYAGDVLARAHAATDVPVALGFGIATPADAAAAAAAGADGVIVGSRLVRAAAESPATIPPQRWVRWSPSSPTACAG